MAKPATWLTFGSACADPDLQLVEAMATGDTEALNSLYQRYGTVLLVYLSSRIGDRQLAEEVLQDVMLAAWKGAARFRGQSSVKTWLLAIARYQASNARTRRPPPGLPLEADWVADQNQPEQLLATNDLQAALLQLPTEQRETLELLFYQDLSAAEVAQVMNVAPGTVKSRLSRARTALRKLIKPGDKEY